jgi:predicted phosphoribosyltransferase
MRDRTGVFRDRREAGLALADMLRGRVPLGARVLAIPAGGVAVAAAVCDRLGLPLDVAVVSKITPAWHSEVGYGAVAFDGRVEVDEARRRQIGVSEAEVAADVERTVIKVRRRLDVLRAGRGPLVSPGDAVVLVDDGLASGITMRVAVEAVRAAGASPVVVAVPTGAAAAVEAMAGLADEVHCANVRTGRSFAVADAYEEWRDEAESAVREILERKRSPSA